ncbi:MAG: universal stress protein [Thaumarchaeota archaeon]|nr:universal stress protein [Nitrososphaerota archaeon]
MVEQIRKILVPLDNSKNSLKCLATAIHIAKEHEASIIAIHVVHEPHGTKQRIKLELDEKIPPSFILSAEKLARDNDIVFSSRLVRGDPGHVIVEFADTRGIDLIIIGARGLSTFKKIFLGSVSTYVLHKSKVPVMLIK